MIFWVCCLFLSKIKRIFIQFYLRHSKRNLYSILLAHLDQHFFLLLAYNMETIVDRQTLSIAKMFGSKSFTNVFTVSKLSDRRFFVGVISLNVKNSDIFFFFCLLLKLNICHTPQFCIYHL